MQSRLGVRGNALALLFNERTTQPVKVSGSVSEEKLIEFSVPQWIILGPLLFSHYSIPLADIANHLHYLKCTGKSRTFFTKEACQVLVHAFVTSRLDFCNSLLYGLP